MLCRKDAADVYLNLHVPCIYALPHQACKPACCFCTVPIETVLHTCTLYKHMLLHCYAPHANVLHPLACLTSSRLLCSITAVMLACNYSNDPGLLQVSGMFVVVVTAVGCLYFFDAEYTGIASKAGLLAVGVLLMVTNAIWVLFMVWLIVKAGLSSAKQLASSTVKQVKSDAENSH